MLMVGWWLGLWQPVKDQDVTEQPCRFMKSDVQNTPLMKKLNALTDANLNSSGGVRSWNLSGKR